MKASISTFSSRITSSFARTAPSARQCFFRRTQRPNSIYSQCVRRQHTQETKQAADDPEWLSPIDNPPDLIRSGRKHGAGVLILAVIPIAAFCLGTWQVQRLDWKTKLIERYESRLEKPPLELPPAIDTAMIPEFDYRRITATGHFRHDQEMLIGPRLYDGKQGYLVVTPLERGQGASTVLICRGWITKEKVPQSTRLDTLPRGEVTVEGLLREPPRGNMFTPDNIPAENKWYFTDVKQMAEHTGARPIFIEETFVPDLLSIIDREQRGLPIGREPEVNLRNNHMQYIITWYGLSFATTIMLAMVLRKKPTGLTQRVRHSTLW